MSTNTIQQRFRLEDLNPQDYPGDKEMDEKLHRKAYAESRKANPQCFNPNFSKHMEKVKQRDESLKKVKQQENKIRMV